MKIAIVGLGYVGLPLSLQFARSGVDVVGLDIDQSKVDALTAGRSYIKHITGEAIAEQVKSGRFEASTAFARVREVEAVIICVPTPLNKNREPDISYILETGRAIAPYLGAAQPSQEESGKREEPLPASPLPLTPSPLPHPSSPLPLPASPLPLTSSPLPTAASAARRAKLVVLESTTYPGTTDEDLLRVLEAGSGLKAGVDFHLAFSPEREDPGNPQSVVATIPKVVGGLTPACLAKAMAVYGLAIKTLVPVSSCRVAEAAKLLENTFRGVNIALVNELKVVFDAMGIDVWEVINAAKTKPFGFMAFYPGPGLGGHCIPIDPFYLTWKAREYGQHTRFIELSGEINTGMPTYVINRTAEALNTRKKAVNGSRVLIVGLAYKPNVDDERESPSYILMEMLQARGAEVAYYDPYVPVIRPTREHAHWTGTKSVAWDRATVSGFDAVIIATNHASVNYRELADWAPCIVDSRNAMAGIPTAPGQVTKA